MYRHWTRNGISNYATTTSKQTTLKPHNNGHENLAFDSVQLWYQNCHDLQACGGQRSKAEKQGNNIKSPISVSSHGTQFPSSLANQDKF